MRSSHTNITDTQNEIGQVRKTQRCMNVHACVIYMYLSIAYTIFGCEVSSLLQEEGADVMVAIAGCK